MNRILVLSPSEDRAGRALTLASALAERSGAALLVLRVLEESVSGDLGGSTARDELQLRNFVLEAEIRELERQVEPLRQAGLQVTVSVCWGVAWEVVVEHVRRGEADLVVKPARGLSHTGRVFFGATALHLFRKCPCPVWVVGDEGRLPAKVLAAIDPADQPQRRQAARRILDWSQRVADWAGAERHVASAWHAPGAELLEGRVPESELKAYVEDARTRAGSALDRLLAEAGASASAAYTHLLEGSPREVLPQFVEERDADLVVMGTLSRAGLVGELLGETAETIIRSVRCSVLTLSPLGSGGSEDGARVSRD